MKTLRIEVEDDLLEKLERVGPSRSQQRFELIGVLGPGKSHDVKRALGYALDWPELKILS